MGDGGAHAPPRAAVPAALIKRRDGQSTQQQVGAGHHPRLTPVCVLSHAPPPP